MEYIHRTMERKFMRMSETFKVVMLVGARQVGKSTMLKHLAKDQNRSYVTLDNAKVRELAQSDPALFFQMYRPPILIDEVQKAPALFEHIKMICDESDDKGLFWLSGSQSKRLLECAGDSLAGRICILKMFSLSAKEMLHIEPERPMDFSLASLTERSRLFPKETILEVFERIWRGGMPDTLPLDSEQREEYWNSYVDTYLMRDAVDDNGIKDTEGFRKLLRACAAFSGQLLNYTDLAASADVSVSTAKEWVKVLQNMGIIFLLEPFFSNELKRMVKTPKLYFCDTGFCAYLSSWTSKETLMNGAAAGHYFENYVVGEFLREYSYGRERANLNFYRDSNQKEIDLIIEEKGILHPIEIKKAACPDKKAVKAFDVLRKSGRSIGKGGVVCMSEEPFPIDTDNVMIPAWIL